jgi:hypothetical protein
MGSPPDSLRAVHAEDLTSEGVRRERAQAVLRRAENRVVQGRCQQVRHQLQSRFATPSSCAAVTVVVTATGHLETGSTFRAAEGPVPGDLDPARFSTLYHLRKTTALDTTLQRPVPAIWLPGPGGAEGRRWMGILVLTPKPLRVAVW